MATPVISPIASEINFVIDTPVNLAVPISNNPSRVVLRGSVEEFYYSWEDGVFYLRGTPKRTRENKRLTIYATDPDDPTHTVEATFIYNVRNAVPIITQIPAQRIVRGVEQSIFIPTANANEVTIEGLLTGLDHEQGQKNGQDGVFIVGSVPIDADFTTETGRFWVNAKSDGGESRWGSIESGGLGWGLARASLPAQVTNLRASVSGTTVTLTWTAPNDGGTPLTNYEYSIDGGDWIPTHSTLPRVAISELVGQPSYNLRVRALNGLGAGPASGSVSVVTIPPRAPAGTISLSAEAGDGHVILGWNHPRDRGAPTAEYSVYRDGTLITTTSDNSYVDENTTNNVSYAYYVQAFNASGSVNSNTVSATPQAPRAPSGTVTLSATGGNGQVVLRWGHPRDRGVPTATYSIYRNGTFIATRSGTSYTDTGRTNGTSYSYYVEASNASGTITSNTVSATPRATAVVVAPVINAISNRSRTSGYSQFTIQASLSSGSTPTWSISGIAGATISQSGLITIPAGLSVATHTATVTATNTAGSDTETFSVVVTAVVAPVINAIPNFSRQVGYSVFAHQTTLSSGTTPVTWRISGITGATISNQGRITIPAGLDVGTYTATVTASNSAGSDTETFDVVVVAQVVAPVINAISNVSRISGYPQFTIQASLSSGSPPTWSISGIAGATISNSGLITIPAGVDVGTYTATVMASNNAGSDTEQFNFEVTAEVTAPVIAAIADVTRSWSDVNFQIQATLSSGTATRNWSISGITGATISTSGLINIPRANALGVGTHTATVTATNSAGSDTEDFDVIVTPGIPRISTIRNRNLLSGYAQFTIQASARNATNITWSISGLTGVTIDQNGLITIPAGLSSGTHTITVTATTTDGSDSESFDLFIF